MRKELDGSLIHSASDLVAFMGCRHRTALDLRKLQGWDREPDAVDDGAALVQDYGNRHEACYLERLVSKGLQVAEIPRNGPLATQIDATRQALRSGADVVYQAALKQGPFMGYADFLLRVPGKSMLGDDWHYEVADTKLAKSNRAKFMIQLCFYADLLAAEQGVMPEHVQVVMGDLTDEERAARGLEADEDHQQRLRTAEYFDFYASLKTRYLQFVEARPETEPEPVPACKQCRWASHCEEEWHRIDHPSQVAGIRRDQIAKLKSAGITTLKALAELPPGQGVKGIGQPVLERLARQAELQVHPTDAAGKLRVEHLPARPDRPSGLGLLPPPDAGDLYFDMEGFPHEPGGLEYLFGVGWADPAEPDGMAFRAFWAHDRAEEKRAFEAFMDFVQEHLRQHPKAHIYHYAAYEKTAIRRLSGVHDTRTELRDRLLREHRLVDLYRVVSGGLLLALPSYSIKKVEAYYGLQRGADVVNAGESIVQYERFRMSNEETERKQLLDEIEHYNRDDVLSTLKLHQWLRTLSAPGPAFEPEPEAEEAEAPGPNAASERLERVKEALQIWINRLPAEQHAEGERVRTLLVDVMQFYWRCKLPTLWRHFERQEATEAELVEDLDCLAMLTLTASSQEKKSIRYSYAVPVQESRLENGSQVRCLTDGLPASNFQYDRDMGVASFTRGVNKQQPPETLTLALHENISHENKLDAIAAFCETLANSGNSDIAVLRLLLRQLPALSGIPSGTPLVTDIEASTVAQAIANLQSSHLVIQGPPGTGKTTRAAFAIAELVAQGKTVAVTANSHAAIWNLLYAAWAQCERNGTSIRAAVVTPNEEIPTGIARVMSEDVYAGNFSLVGGTSWVWCRKELHGGWDYLFVDEASQVSLADLVAAGQCANNIVLLGDQMQLAQPIQGVHPGESGLSALDYIMQGQATVAPHRGIFLNESHRMHPEVCTPISRGIYEGRLGSSENCRQQCLVLQQGAAPALRAAGIISVSVEHQDRSQESPEEVERIRELYDSLLNQSWTDKNGATRPMTAEDILIVAPYNAQRRALAQALGPEARVGTVDKFQGQEAAVAILSMTTSDREHVPRGLEFLFSINRLNVAVSRAKCLALIVASPTLLEISCDDVEDMRRLSLYAALCHAGSQLQA